MADEISIGKQAIKEVQTLRAELVELSKDALAAGKSLSSISTPGALNTAGNNNAKTLAELEALKAKYASLNDTIIKKAEQSRLAEIRLQQQREKAFDSFEKNAKKEVDLLEKQNNEYNKLQRSVNSMTKAYNDLATRKQLGEKLNSNEEKQLKTLKNLLIEYNGVLKSTDSQIGKNQRNVGNYASGYNALGNSINQLTREAPAFVNSINTGFMAISNNIPALTDAIKGIREQNALLRAEGKPTQSVLMQLAGAFFSWQTAISLGVTLLTVYGGQIIGAITGSEKRKKALELEKKALEEKTKAEQDARDAIASVQSVEISRSKILLETASNVTLSYNQRVKAVKELQERYPDYLGHLSKEQILAGDTAKAEEDLNNALISRGKALAAQTFLQTNLEKQLSLEIEIDKLAQRELKYNLEASKNGSQIVIYKDRQKQAEQQKADLERKSNSENLFALRARLTGLKNEQNAFLDIYNANAKYLDVVKETNKEREKETDTTPKVQALESSLKSVGTVLEQLDKQIEETRTKSIVGLAQSTLGMTPEEIKKYKEDNSAVMAQAATDLEKLIELKQKLNGIPEATGKIINTTEIKEAKEVVKELSDEMKNYLKTFSIDFAQSAGFTETFAILNDEIEGFGENFAVTFNAIAESAQEVFNFISNASQQNFEDEKERLQNQYDVALTYAGDNKAAQVKLAEDLEKSKKEIANREAKAKQQQAIFNIAIDTAQGIVSALASTPPNIILSAVIAGIGAAQIAMVSSQKIPQYWMGGTHDGGLMMVNDGQGANFRETIVTPDGKIMKPQGRNVIMDAPVGTEIFTHDQWNQELNNMLQGKGILMSLPQQNSGITKDDLEDVFVRTLGSQTQYYSNFDANGASSYIAKRGNITRMNTNRSNGRGTKFN